MPHASLLKVSSRFVVNIIVKVYSEVWGIMVST